jgi:hypothetical protein
MEGRWPEGDTERNVQEGNLMWNPETHSITPAPTAWNNGEQPPSGDRHRHNRDPQVFGFAMWQLKEGEAELIVNRLVEIFSQASKA